MPQEEARPIEEPECSEFSVIDPVQQTEEEAHSISADENKAEEVTLDSGIKEEKLRNRKKTKATALK